MIVVLLDVNRLCELVKEQGFIGEFHFDDDDFQFHIRYSDGTDFCKVSIHLLTRIGLDFASPRWIAESSVKWWERFIDEQGSILENLE